MKPKRLFTKILKSWLYPRTDVTASMLTSEENTKPSHKNLQQGIQSSNWSLHTCRTLLYRDFITLLTKEDNLSLLVISGEPTQEELETAWNYLLQEYSDLIKTQKSEDIFRLYKKILYTQWSIKFIESACNLLKMQHDVEVAELLSELGYLLVKNKPNRELYLKQIYKIENAAKTLIVVLNQDVAEYKLYCKSVEVAAGDATIDIMGYEKELNILSKFMGYRIDKNIITVFEFCGILNTYLEFQKNSQKKQDG